VVTEFGKPIARLSPVGEPRSLEEAVALGLVTPAKEDWRDLLTIELLPQEDGESVSDTLWRLRQDER
jgi:antitoxin (DNA-binding transcriptional repressor) of toxin-antitoxin stability system